MRVYDESTRRRTRFGVQVNWSRERAFSERQRRWVQDNIPHVRGVYVLYMRDEVYGYGRRRSESPIIYFGSGWLAARLFTHLDRQSNHVIAQHLAEGPLAFRWAEIEDDGREDWPVVVESILVYEFKHLYGELPRGNRLHPPNRRMFEYSLIDQHPFDVIDEL